MVGIIVMVMAAMKSTDPMWMSAVSFLHFGLVILDILWSIR